MENKTMTNKQVENLVRSGMVQKTVWSMIWMRKEMHVQDAIEKGYEPVSVSRAFDKLMEIGAVERVHRGVYKVSDKVVKG